MPPGRAGPVDAGEEDAVTALFDVFDEDQDGMLSRTEYGAFHAATDGQAPTKAGDATATWDAVRRKLGVRGQGINLASFRRMYEDQKLRDLGHFGMAQQELEPLMSAAAGDIQRKPRAGRINSKSLRPQQPQPQPHPLPGGGGTTRHELLAMHARTAAKSVAHQKQPPQAWAPDLAGLVSVIPVKKCLANLGVTSLDAMVWLDDEDQQALVKTVDAIPAKIQRRKCQAVLEPLLARLTVFKEWDTDKNGTLDYYEVDACVQQTFSPQMRSLIFPGGDLRAKFASIDSNGDGKISFHEFYDQCAMDRVFYSLVSNTRVREGMPPPQPADQAAAKLATKSRSAKENKQRKTIRKAREDEIEEDEEEEEGEDEDEEEDD
eukprot:COSAG05_NODE_2583_length_2873_cov_359.798116_1_plen_375_part_10